MPKEIYVKQEESIDEIKERVTNERLKELLEYYPQFFDFNGAFEFDKFKDYLSTNTIEISTEGFSLNFVGKEYAKLQVDTPTETLLSPDVQHNNEEINISSKNVYLVGDNLDVLKHLRRSYTGMVSAIYIDPPYNTGSDDFTYPDKFDFSKEKLMDIFDDEEKAERILSLAGKSSHSAWLTFMFPRIAIAYKLLSSDGVMFVSLDDNEATNMTYLCDEIFGEANRLGPIIQNKHNSKNDTKNIQKNHEFILVYRKRAKMLSTGKEEANVFVLSKKQRKVFREGDEYYYQNDYITTRGEGGTLANRNNLGYTVYYNKDTGDMQPRMDYNLDLINTAETYEELYTDDNDLLQQGYFPVRPPKVRDQFGAWTWEFDTFQDHKKEVMITGSEPNYNIKKRTFIDEEYVFEENGQLYTKMTIENNSRSIVDYPTNAGTSYLKELMGGSEIFTNPKNVDMIEYLIDLVPNKEGIVLDFFSGSGTTADAVMRLNANPGYDLRYILVQLPEQLKEDNPARKIFNFETIDQIGRERIKRAANKIKEETTCEIDYGFKTYFIHERTTPSLESIQDFSDTENITVQTTLGLSTDNYIDQYAYGDASGNDTLLTTWLLDDGLGFDAEIEEVKFNNYTAYKSRNRLYILDEGMTSDDLADMLTQIHAQQLIISNVTIYVHSLSTDVLREMDLALKTTQVRLERRF